MTPASYLPPIPRPPHDPTSWLLNARVGWKRAGAGAGVEQRPGDGALALSPLPGTGRSLAEPSGSFGGLRPPANVAVTADGRIYLLDLAALQLKRFDPCCCGFVALPCFPGRGNGPRSFSDPHGIAVRGDDLYICDTGNHRVAVFALRGPLLRGSWAPPPTAALANPWQPFAIAFDSHGRAFVTDPANGVIHRFSRSGQWEKPLGGFGAVRYIAIDCQDRLHLVIDGSAGIRSVDADGNELPSPEAPVLRPEFLAGEFPPPPFPVDAKGNLYLAGWLPPECLPAPSSSKRPGAPAPPAGVFDPSGNPVDPLGAAAPDSTTYPASPFDPGGTYYSEPLDSLIYHCQWHRIVLCGEVPVGTRLVISTHTSELPESDDELLALPPDAWQTRQTVGNLCGRWDCLVFSGPGRYLRLRIDFYGNGTFTPAIEALAVEFPRVSLRRYLPAVFGAEPVSADFTDRFLGLFDTVFRSIEREIDTGAKFFDPRATPADFLGWLGSWIGVSVDRSWPEAKRRELIRSAGALYSLRGTRYGLWKLLLLYLGYEPEKNHCCRESRPCDRCAPAPRNCAPPLRRRAWQPPPLILEHFQLRKWLFLGQGRLGNEAVLWGKSIVNRSQLNETARVGGTQLLTTQDPYRDPFHKYAHQFTVFVPARIGRDEQQRRALENLIAGESPAQARHQVRYVEPRFRIGVQATIGFDSVIAAAPEGVTLGQTKLNRSRALTAPPGRGKGPALEIGNRSRIGSSTKLS